MQEHETAPCVPYPYLDGEFVVYPDGSRLARVHGGDDNEPEVETETTDQPTDGAGSAPAEGSAQQEPSFTDGFDPSTLPDEAREPYEAAYKRLQADYTKKRQEESARVKEAEAATQFVTALNNPDTRDEALSWVFETFGEDAFKATAKKLGYELDGQDGDKKGSEDQPQEQFQDPRVDQLLEERQQQQYEQQLEALEKSIGSEIDRLDEQHATKLTPDEKAAVFEWTLTMDPTADGPNVSGAFERLTGIVDRRLKSYRESKKQAPAPPNQGSQSGVPTAPVGDGKARRARALEVANQAFASDS